MSETRDGCAALHNRTTAVTTLSKHGLSGGIISGRAALLCVGQAADKTALKVFISSVFTE